MSPDFACPPNSLDYNADLGHIVTNPVQGEFYVIDQDGTFSVVAGDAAAEIANAPAVLKALDADGDGKLSREEWGQRVEEPGRGAEGRRSGRQDPSGQGRKR